MDLSLFSNLVDFLTSLTEAPGIVTMDSAAFNAGHQSYGDKEVSVVIQDLPVHTSNQVSRCASLVERQPGIPSQDDKEGAHRVEEWDGGWAAWSNVASGCVYTQHTGLYAYLHLYKVADHGCGVRGAERLRCVSGFLHEG